MDRIFIPELLLEISNALDMRARFSFGLTCRAVWSVVAGELWRHVSYHRIRRLLPNEIEILQLDHTNAILAMPLTGLEWQPLLNYSHYIRHLYLHDDSRHKQRSMLQQTLGTLATYPGEGPILPRLQSLVLILFSEQSVAAAILFLQKPFECLTDLIITIRNTLDLGSAGVILLMDEIARNHHIRSLNIHVEVKVDATYDRLETATATAISGLSSLKQLSLALHVDGALFLSSSAALPALEKLSLAVHDTAPDLDLHPLPPSAFPSLIALSIESNKVQSHPNCAQLLSKIVSSRLAEFECRCYITELASVQESLRVVAGKWSSTFLKLILHVEWLAEDKRPRLIYDALSPLTACRRLQSLRVESEGPIDLLDEHCDAMSVSWPSLRALSIDHVYLGDMHNRWVQRGTRRSLAMFAARCPSLVFLNITVDYNTSCGSAAFIGPPSTSLLHLSSGYSHCLITPKPVEALDFLRHVFPNIHAFYSQEPRLMRHVEGTFRLERAFHSDASMIYANNLTSLPLAWRN